MIHLLQYLFSDSPDHVSILARTMGAGLTSAVLVMLLCPWFINTARRRGWCEQSRDYSESSIGKAGTPTMGGILIYVVVLATALVWCKLTTAYSIVPLLAGAAFGAVGLFDDTRKIKGKSSEAGISRRWKYVAQIVLGGGVALLFLLPATSPIEHYAAMRWSLYLPFMRGGLYLGLAYAAMIVMFMVAASNAVNFTDGMDGLAIVPTILVALVLGAFGYIIGRVDYAEYLGYFPSVAASGEVVYGLANAGELMVLGAAVAGAGIGFLWFNAHPAALFMGDTGSMALGGILGTMAVLGKQEVIFFIAGGLFVLEFGSVFIQDYIGLKLLGRRLFFRAPLHHNMLHKGTAETKVTVRLWIIAGFCAVLAMATLKMR